MDTDIRSIILVQIDIPQHHHCHWILYIYNSYWLWCPPYSKNVYFPMLILAFSLKCSGSQSHQHVCIFLVLMPHMHFILCQGICFSARHVSDMPYPCWVLTGPLSLPSGCWSIRQSNRQSDRLIGRQTNRGICGQTDDNAEAMVHSFYERSKPQP